MGICFCTAKKLKDTNPTFNVEIHTNTCTTSEFYTEYFFKKRQMYVTYTFWVLILFFESVKIKKTTSFPSVQTNKYISSDYRTDNTHTFDYFFDFIFPPPCFYLIFLSTKNHKKMTTYVIYQPILQSNDCLKQ